MENNRVELCYICSPYKGADELEIEQNILEARKLAVKVIRETGWFAVTPCLNTAFFHRYEKGMLPIGEEFWLDGDVVLLMRCDSIAVSGDMRWKKSSGCLNELKVAIDLARQGQMKIWVGGTIISDLDAFEGLVDEAKGGLPFRKRVAPASGGIVREIPKPPEWDDDCEQKALEIAFRAHAGKIDKTGRPRVYHSLAVAAHFDSVLFRIVAILHDVVEDASVTMEDIHRMFPESVSCAVDAVTRRAGESLDDCLARCMSSIVAREVKTSDIKHHLGCFWQIPEGPERDLFRAECEKTLSVLMGTAG